jgi:hypothetical protein
MRNILIIIFIITANLCFSQTHTRKTRSDKGKTHNHSATYIAKKAIKPKSTKTKKKK